MKTTSLVVALTTVNITLVILNAALYSVAAPQEDPTVVRAQIIELVDEEGNVRAQLNVESDGSAMFRMRDPSGAIRVKLEASAVGSGLVLLNEATEPGLHALATREKTHLTIREGERERVLTP
jgi:hypothetical protein